MSRYSEEMEMDYNDFNDYGDFDDDGVEFRCTNSECECFGETYFADAHDEYQGDYPHGGVVTFVDEALCPECSETGEEV